MVAGSLLRHESVDRLLLIRRINMKKILTEKILCHVKDKHLFKCMLEILVEKIKQTCTTSPKKTDADHLEFTRLINVVILVAAMPTPAEKDQPESLSSESLSNIRKKALENAIEIIQVRVIGTTIVGGGGYFKRALKF